MSFFISQWKELLRGVRAVPVRTKKTTFKPIFKPGAGIAYLNKSLRAGGGYDDGDSDDGGAGGGYKAPGFGKSKFYGGSSASMSADKYVTFPLADAHAVASFAAVLRCYMLSPLLEKKQPARSPCCAARTGLR